MPKPKRNLTSSLFSMRKRQFVVLLVSILVLAVTPFVYADTLQQQINNLNNQNNQKQSTVNDLQLQASSYQDAISKLQQQIDAIGGAIQASQDQQAKLQQEIVADQQQIDQKKQQLSATVKALYIDGQTTTIEELASSKNLSDYVDKEEYRTAVQNQLDAKIKEIAALQQQQQTQKVQVDQLLTVQRQQQAQLDSDQQQKANLLNYNEGQRSQYNQQIATNKQQISVLQAEQARINAANTRVVNVAASGGSGGACDVGYGNGGYPMAWCDAPANNGILDSNGIEVRQCTSFAYWYFTSVEGKSLTVTGDAKNWAFTANRPVDHTPEVGAIGVSTSGYYGHVVIVVATAGQSYGGVTVPSGSVLTMSMNFDFYGHFHYSEYSADYLYYIH